MSELLLRRRALLMSGKKPRLPREYQEVEYLESTGTQYINANILPSAVTAMEWTIATDREFDIGSRDSAYTKSFVIWNRQSTGNIAYSIGNYTSIPVYVFASQNKKATYRLDISGNLSIDGKVVAKSSQTWDVSTYPIYVCLFNNGGSAVSGTAYGGKVYCAALFSNYYRARDFIPCYRNSDNKPGMYDLSGSICPLTNSPFYINAGTDEFRFGPDVN